MTFSGKTTVFPLNLCFVIFFITTALCEPYASTLTPITNLEDTDGDALFGTSSGFVIDSWSEQVPDVPEDDTLALVTSSPAPFFDAIETNTLKPTQASNHFFENQLTEASRQPVDTDAPTDVPNPNVLSNSESTKNVVPVDNEEPVVAQRVPSVVSQEDQENAAISSFVELPSDQTQELPKTTTLQPDVGRYAEQQLPPQQPASTLAASPSPTTTLGKVTGLQSVAQHSNAVSESVTAVKTVAVQSKRLTTTKSWGYPKFCVTLFIQCLIVLVLVKS